MVLASINKNGYYAKKDGMYFEFTWTSDDKFVIHRQMRSTIENPDEYEIVEVIDGIEQDGFTTVKVVVPDTPHTTKRFYTGKVVICGDSYEYTLVTEQEEGEEEKITKIRWYGDCEPHSISPKQLNDIKNLIRKDFNNGRLQ